MSTLYRRTRRLTLLLLVTLLMLTATAACGGSSETSDEPLDPPPTRVETVQEAVEEPADEIIVDAIEGVTPGLVTEEPPVAVGEDVIDNEPDVGDDDDIVPVLTAVPPTALPRSTPTPRPTPDFGSVAYDVPTQMVRGEIVQVVLLVSPDEDSSEALTRQLADELAEVDQTPGNVITATVRTARRMSAQLSAIPSDAFDIVPLQTSNIQFLDDIEPTKWEWSVRPLTGGTHQLSLVIERFEVIDGEPTLRGEESYRDAITVEVPPSLLVQDFAASPLGIVAFLALAGIIGLTVYLRRRAAVDLLSGRQTDEALSREAINRVTPILADALAQLTAEQRVAFLSQAGVGEIVDVNLNGSARTVAMTILSELNRYGETADGRPAIFLLLDYLAANPALPRRDKATLDELTDS